MMMTTAAPPWLRRSDQAVTWARNLLHPRTAVIIDTEQQICRGQLVARSDIRTCGIEPRLSLPPSRKALKVRDSQSRRIM